MILQAVNCIFEILTNKNKTMSDSVVLRVNQSGRTLTITLTINGIPQKIKLGSARVLTDGTSRGISIDATIDSTGSSPSVITLTSTAVPSGTYDFVELNTSNRKPNPRYIVKVIIPN